MKFTALTNIGMGGSPITYGDTVDIDLSVAWQLCESGAIYPIPSDLEEAERAGLPLKPEAAAEALRVRNARNEALQEAHRIRAEIAAIKKNASLEAWRLIEAEDRQGKLAFPVTLTREGNSASEPPVHRSESQEKATQRALGTTERNSLLVIIATLCRAHVGIDHQAHGAAARISKMTENSGVPVSPDTVKRVLSIIPNALESRTK